MNRESNKKENRKALKIFIPIIMASALAGGIIGAFSNTMLAEKLAHSAGDILRDILFLTAPYAVIIIVLSGIGISFFCYRGAKRLYESSLSEKDEDSQEEILRRAESGISKGMLAASASEILSITFFAAAIAYIRDYVDDRLLIYSIMLAVFVAGNFVRVKVQQLMVDFQKTMNPEKRGSVYDINFRKKWEESCDELEKLMIYKASYKAFRLGSMACSIVFVALMLLGFFFDYGPLPAMAVGIIWLVNTVSYCKETMRLEKEKINF